MRPDNFLLINHLSKLIVISSYACVVWEILFLACSWRGWGRIVCVALGVMFHVGTYLLLGLTFLAGQIGVFSQLASEGLYLNTGRQASFYYVLAGLHGIHILGGILALGWTALRLKPATLEVTSIYWHFMDALWIYLLLVIFI